MSHLLLIALNLLAQDSENQTEISKETVAMGSVKLREYGRVSDTKWDHKGRSQIVQIVRSYNPFSIVSLQFYYLVDGLVVPSEIIGCQSFSGPVFNVITFSPDEFITTVRGFHWDKYQIEQLTVETSKKLYCIFKAEIDPDNIDVNDDAITSFSYDFGGANQFGGFYGTHTSEEVTSIGFYFNPLTAPPSIDASASS